MEIIAEKLMTLEIDLAVAKTEKYASRESGDTVELVERPGGGFSVVVVDGQGSGKAAKTLSLLLSSKAVALLKEGVRDGAVARATHDFLYAFRHGQVSATLDIVSIDLRTMTAVVTRNAQAPMIVRHDGVYRVVPAASGPIGYYHWTRPAITELPIGEGFQIILFTDGIAGAGERRGHGPFDMAAFVEATFHPEQDARTLADALLDEALRRDQGRPADDMAVVALTLRSHAAPLLIRRLTATVPLP